VNGVAIDLLCPDSDEKFLEDALSAPPGSFLEAPALVYMKLKSPRRKYQVDVIELIKVGIDVAACREYLNLRAPSFAAAFEECVARAEAEDG
jgi:hypothetical protein